MDHSQQHQLTRQDDTPSAGQFSLLRQGRFAPFFWTQFLGAGNDNLFKFAFTILVTYQLQLSWLPPAQAGLVIGALFILPFLLFSATSGQLADKFDKARLIRHLKTAEIGIMLLAALGFLSANVPLLLTCIFLMGMQSTLFGPVKYAYLPQHLNERELTGGNGMVEMGTFVAILLGNLAGGLLISIEAIGPTTVALTCVALAVLGRLTSSWVPSSPSTDPHLKINWNPVSETVRNLRLAYQDKTVFRSLLGISWMWFFGAVFLSQFPSFSRDVLGGNEQVASLLLVVFSIGIGGGSLACEFLSRRHVEIGLVPLGAIGMTVFCLDLYLATRGSNAAGIIGVSEFLAITGNWRVIFDLLLLSFFTGLFSVPMYALIQHRSKPTHRARIIAANNILNALFMIISSIGAGALLASGASIPEVFLVIGILNAVVATYIFTLVPEYLLRFISWVLSRLVYRFQVRGDDHIPSNGAAVIAANHVSFVDAILLMGASPRPVRFLMDYRIFENRLLGPIFRLAQAIPIAPASENQVVYERAISQARQTLADGGILGIFPEGRITEDGQLHQFKPGLLKILASLPPKQTSELPVLPVSLQNLWGSYFSRVEAGRAMTRPFRRGIGNRVGIHFGDPMPASTLDMIKLKTEVQRLHDDPII
ncbi:MAG: MFS transporter [Burkholderiaceae bacterium]